MHRQPLIALFLILSLALTLAPPIPLAAQDDGGVQQDPPDLIDLLPDEDQVPPTLALVEAGGRSGDEVAASFLDPAEAADRLAAWGWEENAYRNFSDDGPAPGVIGSLEVSLHRFRSESDASNALIYFAEGRALSLGLEKVAVARIGEQTRAVGGSVDAGTEFTLYVRFGDVLMRVSAVSLDDDPTAAAEDVARGVVANAEHAAKPESANTEGKDEGAPWGIDTVTTADLTPAELEAALPKTIAGIAVVTDLDAERARLQVHSFATESRNFIYADPSDPSSPLVVNASAVGGDLSVTDAIGLILEDVSNDSDYEVESVDVRRSTKVPYLLAKQVGGDATIYGLIWGARYGDWVFTVFADSEEEREELARALVANLEGGGSQPTPPSTGGTLFVAPDDPDRLMARLSAAGFPDQTLPVDVTGRGIWRADRSYVSGGSAGAAFWVVIDLDSEFISSYVEYAVFATVDDARAAQARLAEAIPVIRSSGGLAGTPLTGVPGLDGPGVLWVEGSDPSQPPWNQGQPKAGTLAQVGNVVIQTYVLAVHGEDPIRAADFAVALTEAGIVHLQQGVAVRVDLGNRNG